MSSPYPPSSNGGLYPNASDNPKAPRQTGFLIVPEGARPGDKIVLSAWPARDRHDGALSLKARRQTGEEQDADLRRRVEKVFTKFLRDVEAAPTLLGLQRLVEGWNQSEAKLHLTAPEQDQLERTIAQKRDELEGIAR